MPKCWPTPVPLRSNWRGVLRKPSASPSKPSMTKPTWTWSPRWKRKPGFRPASWNIPISVSPTRRSGRSASPSSGSVMVTTTLDLAPVRAFLDERHVGLAAGIVEFSLEKVALLPEPEDDAAARLQARELVAMLGRAGWFAPIVDQELRSCCLIREALAAASPLADAVFALQALGSLPIVRAGNSQLKERWLPAMLEGRAMASFAMTEPDAGSDVASLTTSARRDGRDYVLQGKKTFISNAGIADF